MSVPLVDGRDVLVCVEGATATELVSLLYPVFDVLRHQLDPLLLRQRLSSILHELWHLVYSLLVRSVQAVRIEDFPTVRLLRLLVSFSLLAAEHFLCLSRTLEQVLFVLIDALTLQVPLGQPLILEVLLFGFLAFVEGVIQTLLLLEHCLVVHLDRLINLELQISFASLER